MSTENEKFLMIIDNILKETREYGTNFERCFPEHIAIYLKYHETAKTLRMEAFPDRETYQKFACAKLFMDKLKYVTFQNDNDTLSASEDDLPPLEAFHYTEDEIEMKKNRILESINIGDVLHLKVVEETEEYNLQVLNKYGDKQRMIDCSIFAVLIKKSPYVQNINPPLKVGDLIRATAFGNLKQEKGKFKKMIVSLNPSFIAKQEFKHLSLGRVYKKDIPFYPEDISQYNSFGEYLKSKTRFKSPEDILKYIRSFGCDPTKTGPLYETKYKKQIPENVDRLIDATQQMTISRIKTGKAVELLNKGELLNALLQIEEVLEESPESDMALTIRGKIYMALAGGGPSRNMKRAFFDFEAALTLNRFNKEAKELRLAVISISMDRYTEQGLLEKAKQCENQLRKHPLSVATKEFLNWIKERKDAETKMKNTNVSSSHSVPEVKEEPMDV